ncbi:hypothetical protein DPMN_034570 [Dreissena polymorpha]|uniref:Uncharacterized protein n=1 Tax=Dreissena polymorpha TaxID=45954 RepID=A0A9D4M5Y7_DREPO|nr:hypothetical protein DPMN_034570 [Dreissena polymorpha]
MNILDHGIDTITNNIHAVLLSSAKEVLGSEGIRINHYFTKPKSPSERSQTRSRRKKSVHSQRQRRRRQRIV